MRCPNFGALRTRRSAYLQVLLPLKTHRSFRGFGVAEVLSQSGRRGAGFQAASFEVVFRPHGPRPRGQFPEGLSCGETQLPVTKSTLYPRMYRQVVAPGPTSTSLQTCVPFLSMSLTTPARRRLAPAHEIKAGPHSFSSQRRQSLSSPSWVSKGREIGDSVAEPHGRTVQQPPI